MNRHSPVVAVLAALLATSCGDASNSYITGAESFSRAGVTVPAPSPLSPVGGQLIPQNNPSIGCPFHPTRGFGHRIMFDWTDARASAGIAGYELVARRQGAILPIVNTFVVESEFTFTSCNAFVIDANLGEWRWMVRAQDTDGNYSAWRVARFGFEPCRLASGTPCFAM